MVQDHPIFDESFSGGKRSHTPVLLTEVLHYLKPRHGDSFLDVTAGYGGHAAAVIERTKASNRSVLIDRDPVVADFLQEKFGGQTRIIQRDFLSASQDLAHQNERFDMILADLGVSSVQFDEAFRGFSLKSRGPLDMRMDEGQKIDAGDILNRSGKKDLIRILREYGEEYRADDIAAGIIKNRPINDTSEFAEIVSRVVGYNRRSKIHPATKSFQAFRIAVNDELNQLEKSLPVWLDLLNSGGRLVVISFHSLEDRLVKRFLLDHSSSGFDGVMTLLTKKPVTAKPEEIVSNPRARSAKLRAGSKK